MENIQKEEIEEKKKPTNKICHKCGNEAPKLKSRYCNKCGTNIQNHIIKNNTLPFAFICVFLMFIIFSLFLILLIFSLDDVIYGMSNAKKDYEGVVLWAILSFFNLWILFFVLFAFAWIGLVFYLFLLMRARRNPSVQNFKKANIMNIAILAITILLLVISLSQLAILSGGSTRYHELGGHFIEINVNQWLQWFFILMSSVVFVCIVFSRLNLARATQD